MGCCISAGDRGRAAETPPRSPSAEEETVKEVLMETVPAAVEGVKRMPEGNLGHSMEAGSSAEIRRGTDRGNEEIVSEASEACSYDESYSSAAAAAPERKDDEEEGVVNQRIPVRKRRAPAGGRGRGRGRAVAEKRGQVAPLRTVRGRATAAQSRSVENGRRRDVGEGYGWRSRSPERVPAGLREEKNGSMLEATNGVVLADAANGVVLADAANDVVLGEATSDVVSGEEVESLENPIVSLECFIFL